MFIQGLQRMHGLIPSRFPTFFLTEIDGINENQNN